jgi:hypothetical protein
MIAGQPTWPNCVHNAADLHSPISIFREDLICLSFVIPAQAGLRRQDAEANIGCTAADGP